MSVALPFIPLLEGYSEKYFVVRSMQTCDDGQVLFTNLQDVDDNTLDWAKVDVRAKYSVLGEKDCAAIENLLIEGKDNFIWMPLWWSQMQIDETFTSPDVTVDVTDSSILNNTSTAHTQFQGTEWGYTNEPRPNIRAMLMSASDHYVNEVLEISSVASTSITLTSAPTNTYVSGDFITPVIKAVLNRSTVFRNRHQIKCDVTILASEL